MSSSIETESSLANLSATENSSVDKDNDYSDQSPQQTSDSSSTEANDNPVTNGYEYDDNVDMFDQEQCTNNLDDESDWLDIIGSGDFKKRVLKPGKGVATRPQQGNLVLINYTCCDDTDLVIEEASNFEMVVGDFDIVQGVDLAIPLMEEGEVAEVLIPSRLAFGKLGRPPDIKPNCNVRYILEVLKSSDLLESQLSLEQMMKFGNKKRDRGNYWYSRCEYLNAVHCYQRAVAILEGVYDGSDSSPEMLQEVLDTKIKVYNNMAASQLKLEAYDQALKSVDLVLRIQPKNVKAHFRKSKILTAKGLTDEAFVAMKRAAEIEPETKVIQQELQKLSQKRKQEEKAQRDMYKRMFPQDTSKSRSTKKWIKPWSLMAGSCLALALGVAAYRQYFA